MSADELAIAEYLRREVPVISQDDCTPSLADAVEAVFELHRGPHTCRDAAGVTTMLGGRDRPSCATLAALLMGLRRETASDVPVRTLADVERLGPLGCKADALLYGSLHVQDTPQTRSAVEQWAKAEGVFVRWH